MCLSPLATIMVTKVEMRYKLEQILGARPPVLRETGAYISLGFSERDAVSGTLYNSNVIFEPDGSYKVHRKLKPTGSERVVWGDADKEYFPVTETPWGPIGSMICWESYMPLARNYRGSGTVNKV